MTKDELKAMYQAHMENCDPAEYCGYLDCLGYIEVYHKASIEGVIQFGECSPKYARILKDFVKHMEQCERGE